MKIRVIVTSHPSGLAVVRAVRPDPTTTHGTAAARKLLLILPMGPPASMPINQAITAPRLPVFQPRCLPAALVKSPFDHKPLRNLMLSRM